MGLREGHKEQPRGGCVQVGKAGSPQGRTRGSEGWFPGSGSRKKSLTSYVWKLLPTQVVTQNRRFSALNRTTCGTSLLKSPKARNPANSALAVWPPALFSIAAEARWTQLVFRRKPRTRFSERLGTDLCQGCRPTSISGTFCQQRQRRLSSVQLKNSSLQSSQGGRDLGSVGHSFQQFNGALELWRG